MSMAPSKGGIEALALGGMLAKETHSEVLGKIQSNERQVTVRLRQENDV